MAVSEALNRKIINFIDFLSKSEINATFFDLMVLRALGGELVEILPIKSQNRA